MALGEKTAMADVNDDDDAPLDPATERLRRKMVRLLAVAVATMLIGVMAVLGAVVYKINQDSPAAGDLDLAIDLPAGSAIADMALDGDEALLRLEGATSDLLRVDLRTGAIIARYKVSPP
ncbi:hypothetical protein GCM10011335_10740 [Aureimonas glaciei]|uniref:Fimbrial protein n=1 Tax=Aureimonas glaciei TaxID=1776957 RepID=A0A916XTU3_9HYPH|nr:hypothetical protein GCM10011335_10740 [Aureimonas glaciei]